MDHVRGRTGMRDRWWAAVLVDPAPLYAGLLALAHFWAGGIAFPLGFLLALVFGSLTGFGVIRRPVWVWTGRLLFVLAGLLPIDFASYVSGGVLDLAAGIILGSPFLWLEYAWRETPLPGTRVVALQSALLYGVLWLATLNAAAPPNGGSGGGQFLHALGQVVWGQVQGIAAVLFGTTPVSMPLETTFDAVYVGLGGLALAAVLLSWVSPRTALDEPLPWSWVRNRPLSAPSLPAPEELGLRAGQNDVLATRTPPEAPEKMLAPGFGPLIAASLVVLGFLLLAATAPTFALLILVVGTVGAVVAVALVLSRRLTTPDGLGT